MVIGMADFRDKMRDEQKNISDWQMGSGQFWIMGAGILMALYFVVQAVWSFFA